MAAATLGLSACRIGAPARANDGDATTTPSPAEQRDALAETVGEYLGRHPGLVASISVRHGDTVIDFGTDRRFETASIVKVEILIRWLAARQDAPLPDGERELAERMITRSDNEATSELCELLADEATAVDVPGGTGACVGESGWGTDETTAADQAEVLTAAFGDAILDSDSRDLVRELMGSVTTEQAWGVAAAADSGERTWLKNGWDIRDNGWLAHSVGVIDSHDGEPVYLTVLTNGNDTRTEGIAHVEHLAELARDALD